jgi:hypothetical protein
MKLDKLVGLFAPPFLLPVVEGRLVTRLTHAPGECLEYAVRPRRGTRGLTTTAD